MPDKWRHPPFAGALAYLFLARSFLRVVVTTGVILPSLLSLAWFLVLSDEERDFVRKGLSRLPFLRRER